jgi:mannose-1-phosphate guanylyltransferase
MKASRFSMRGGRVRYAREHVPAGSRSGVEPWSVILAGGEGERIKPFIKRWLKRHKPKQYCAFVGTRSMLQHTLARADLLSPRERQLTVIKRSHLGDARLQLAGRPLKTVILQPENCDTGAGVFLPITYIRKRDPDATVLVYPSDHFIYPEDRFAEIVNGAVQTADEFPEKLVLLGVAPDSPEPDYGWIIPGKDRGWVDGRMVSSVRSFLEKPGAAGAQAAQESGGVWNTLIFAVRVETLWSMGKSCFPEMMPLFEQLGSAIGTPAEGALLDAIYRIMPVRNFSSGLLSKVAERVVVIELEGVFWSDWGRPERIAETLRRMDKTPAFPWACLESEFQAP